MSAPEWLDEEKKSTRELCGLVLGFLAGTVVLLPSLGSLIHPPYVGGYLLFGFLLTVFLSFILLCITLYLTFTKSNKRPAKRHSYGNLLAIFSFIFFTIFFLINVYYSLNTNPEIEDFSYTPLNFKEGDIVRFNVKAKDKDNDDLNYVWSIDGKAISKESFAYYSFSILNKEIAISIEVRDSRGNLVSKKIIIPARKNLKLKNKHEIEMKDIDNAATQNPK